MAKCSYCCSCAGVRWNTMHILLLSLARFTTRKPTPHIAAIIGPTNTLYIQHSLNLVQPSLECLQASYYPQRKLHYRKLVYLLQNPAWQSKIVSLSAGDYWLWWTACSLVLQTVWIPYGKPDAKKETGILLCFSRTCINIRTILFALHLPQTWTLPSFKTPPLYQAGSNNICFYQVLTKNLEKQ